MSELKLDEVDRDGAIRESAERAREEVISEGGEGDTRLEFLRKAGLTGGALVGGSALLGTAGSGAAAAAVTDRGKGKGNGRPPRKFG